MGEPVGEIGMEAPVRGDGRPVSQHPLEHPVSPVLFHDPVAVPDPERPAADPGPQRLRMDFRAQPFREKGPEPEIVIPREIQDFNVPGPATFQGDERAEEPARDHGRVFEPEIEQVPENEQGVSGTAGAIQEIDKDSLLTVLDLPCAEPQMCVRNEIGRRHDEPSIINKGPRRKRRGITGILDDGRRMRRGSRLVGAASSSISDHPKKWNQNEQTSGRPIKTKMYGISSENAILFFVY
jgi:hypothetical protein